LSAKLRGHSIDPIYLRVALLAVAGVLVETAQALCEGWQGAQYPSEFAESMMPALISVLSRAVIRIRIGATCESQCCERCGGEGDLSHFVFSLSVDAMLR
jgi:hypothetical protein